MHAQMHACDWTDFALHEAKILAAVDRGDKAIKPLPLIALRSTMAQQQPARARSSARNLPVITFRPVIANHRHDRLRIAYLSADFRTHPTSQLIAGLIEHHDRARFEVLGVYVGPPQQDEWRHAWSARVRPLFDFHGNSDEAIATALRIAGNRHPDRSHGTHSYGAPWRTGGPHCSGSGQPSGLSGTAGAPFVDYRHHCRPGVDRAGRSRLLRRKIVTLPHTYQPNDDKRRCQVTPVGRTTACRPRASSLLFQQFVQDHAGRIRHLDATVAANRRQRALAAAADRSG